MDFLCGADREYRQTRQEVYGAVIQPMCRQGHGFGFTENLAVVMIFRGHLGYKQQHRAIRVLCSHTRCIDSHINTNACSHSLQRILLSRSRFLEIVSHLRPTLSLVLPLSAATLWQGDNGCVRNRILYTIYFYTTYFHPTH